MLITKPWRLLKAQEIKTRSSKYELLIIPNIRTKQYTQSVKLRCFSEWNKFQMENKDTHITL